MSLDDIMSEEGKATKHTRRSLFNDEPADVPKPPPVKRLNGELKETNVTADCDFAALPEEAVEIENNVEQTVFVDAQPIIPQETVASVPACFLPLEKEAEMKWDENNNVSPPELNVVYETVHPSVSLAWSMIPERRIFNDEVENATENLVAASDSQQAEVPYDMDTSDEFLPHIAHLEQTEPETLRTEDVQLTEGNLKCLVPTNEVTGLVSPQSLIAEGAEKEVPISHHDIESFMPNHVLTEKAVDFYFSLIVRKVSSKLSICVFPSDHFKHFVLNEGPCLDVDWLSYDIVFVPVHLNVIWCLCVLWPQQKKIIFYDSMCLNNEECLLAVVRLLEDCHVKTRGHKMDWCGWTSEYAEDVHINNDVSNCASISCCYARQICEGESCAFDVEHWQEVRMIMAQEVRQAQLVPLPLIITPVAKVTQDIENAGNLLPNVDSGGVPLSGALAIFDATDIDSDGMTLHVEAALPTTDNEGVNHLLTIHSGGVPLSDALEIFDATGIDSDIMTLHVETAAPATDNEGAICISSYSEDDVPLQAAQVVAMNYSDEIIVSRCGYDVRGRDMDTLNCGQWLNDIVINVYLSLVAEASNVRVHSFSTHFFPKLLAEGYEAVKKWTKKVDIFDFHFVLVPIHDARARHWVITIVNMELKTVTFFDSLGSMGKEVFKGNSHNDQVLKYLQMEHLAKKGKELSEGWVKIIDISSPRQDNGDDCGVYACLSAKCICLGADFWYYCCRDMPAQRDEMKKELLRGAVSLPAHVRGDAVLPAFRPRSAVPILPPSHPVRGVLHACLIQSGSLSQRSEVFPSDRRNAQCTAISACAIAAFEHLHRPFTNKEIDTLIFVGDDLYVQCRTNALNPVHENWLTPDDIPSVFTLLGVQVYFHIEYVGGGVYSHHKRVYELSNAVEASLSQSSKGYFFVGRSKTLSFFPIPQGGFYLFNSHCVTVDNRLEMCTANGAARLFKCDTALALSKLIFVDDVLDNSMWSLVRVEVAVIK